MAEDEKSEFPEVFRVPLKEALEVQTSRTGDVGRLFTGEGLEAEWVYKKQEDVDADWFCYPSVDLLVVIEGQLKVEFERNGLEPRLLNPGDVLVVPPNTRCRAFRWPPESPDAAIFVAVHPAHAPTSGHPLSPGNV